MAPLFRGVFTCVVRARRRSFLRGRAPRDDKGDLSVAFAHRPMRLKISARALRRKRKGAKTAWTRRTRGARNPAWASPRPGATCQRRSSSFTSSSLWRRLTVAQFSDECKKFDKAIPTPFPCRGCRSTTAVRLRQRAAAPVPAGSCARLEIVEDRPSRLRNDYDERTLIEQDDAGREAQADPRARANRRVRRRRADARIGIPQRIGRLVLPLPDSPRRPKRDP